MFKICNENKLLIVRVFFSKNLFAFYAILKNLTENAFNRLLRKKVKSIKFCGLRFTQFFCAWT